MSAKKVSVFVGILVGICSLVGAVIAVDSHYAKQKYVESIEQRLDQKIWSDRYYQIQQRIWQLEDRYPDKEKMPKSVKEELRKLEFIREQIEKKLKIPVDQMGALTIAAAHAKATAGQPLPPKDLKLENEV